MNSCRVVSSYDEKNKTLMYITLIGKPVYVRGQYSVLNFATKCLVRIVNKFFRPIFSMQKSLF